MSVIGSFGGGASVHNLPGLHQAEQFYHHPNGFYHHHHAAATSYVQHMSHAGKTCKDKMIKQTLSIVFILWKRYQLDLSVCRSVLIAVINTNYYSIDEFNVSVMFSIPPL